MRLDTCFDHKYRCPWLGNGPFDIPPYSITTLERLVGGSERKRGRLKSGEASGGILATLGDDLKEAMGRFPPLCNGPVLSAGEVISVVVQICIVSPHSYKWPCIRLKARINGRPFGQRPTKLCERQMVLHVYYQDLPISKRIVRPIKAQLVLGRKDCHQIRLLPILSTVLKERLFLLEIRLVLMLWYWSSRYTST